MTSNLGESGSSRTFLAGVAGGPESSGGGLKPWAV
jgi:hypothetical protein